MGGAEVHAKERSSVEEGGAVWVVENGEWTQEPYDPATLYKCDECTTQMGEVDEGEPVDIYHHIDK